MNWFLAVLSAVSFSYLGNAYCSCNGDKFKINPKIENFALDTPFKGLTLFFFSFLLFFFLGGVRGVDKENILFIVLCKQIEKLLNWNASLCSVHLIDRFLIWEFLLFSCMLIKPFRYMVGHDIHAYSTWLFRAYVCSAPLSMAYMLAGNLIGHGP